MSEQIRARRFERQLRDGEVTQNVVLTDDDIAVLWHVYRHRLIDSDALYRLFSTRSRQQMSRRLNLLFRNHYLGRPPKQIELFPQGSGSNHLVYGLDREGAKFLNERFGVNVRPYHWLQKNREISRSNIAHTVSTANFMADLEISIRAAGNARIVHFDELLADYAPTITLRRPIPERWQIDVNWKGHREKEGTRPDRIFAIEYANLPTGKNRSFFYFENDEGTESIEPTIDNRQVAAFFRKSSILRKFVVYSFSHLTRAHETHFGWPVAARILMLTTSSKRVEAMQASFRAHFSQRPLLLPSGLFLFADKETFAAHDAALVSAPWQDADGKVRHIDDR